MIRLLTFFCSLALLSGCASWGPADPEKAELHLRMGTSLLESGNYPLALGELLQAEKLDDTNPIIQNNLGLAYFARERADLAEKHVRKALKLKSDYTDARNNLGRILLELDKYAEAEKILKEATTDLTYPSPEKPFLNLGLVYFRQRRFDDAKKAFAKSLDYQRNNCLGQTMYGRTLMEMKDFQGAALALDRAIGFCREGQIDEPQYYSALAYYQVGDQRKAESRLEEIIRIYPNGRYRDRARSMLDTMRK